MSEFISAKTIINKHLYQHQLRKKLLLPLMVVAAIFSMQVVSHAQTTNFQDSILQEVTIGNAINYAIKHQPLIQQSLIDEEITETTIRSKLSEWYPQVNFNYNLQHNFLRQTSIIGGNPVQLGVDNTSAGQFSVSQNIFNRDLLLASRTKDDVRLQSRQMTASDKIDISAAVAKAFYDVLATIQQIKVSGQNITRLEKSLKDAYSFYQAGIADKTDYKRATISLNNAKAQQKSNLALQQSKLEYLKSLMGYPIEGQLNIVFDSLQMEREVVFDTLQLPDYSSRIEYKQLETQRRLLLSNLKYNRWSYLPTVSANGGYNFNFQNDQFGKLYNTNYPNSFAALTLSLPIFQGGKRKANIDAAEWRIKRNDLDIINLKNTINAEYAEALAVYKSNLANYLALKDNRDLAQEVYDVIQLQYRSGIKAYLEVITAEADLRTAQINYYNALYQTLANKIDVEKALGLIQY